VSREVPTQLEKPLRHCAHALVAAVLLSLGVAVAVGSGHQLLALGALSGAASFVVWFLLQRARGVAASLGAITVREDLAAHEVKERDWAAVGFGAVLALGLLGISCVTFVQHFSGPLH
jgi:hypothetical protein